MKFPGNCVDIVMFISLSITDTVSSEIINNEAAVNATSKIVFETSRRCIPILAKQCTRH